MISKIRIQNFKSLHDVEVSFSPVTVLIGRGGTGKTNFVDAVRFVRDLLLLGENAVNNRGGWSRIVPANAPDSFRVAFDVVFEVPGIAGDLIYQLAFSKPPDSRVPQFAKERLSIGKHVLFQQEEKQWVIKPIVANPPAPGTIAINRIRGIQEIAIACLALSNGIGCYDFPGDVLRKHTPSSDAAGLLDDGGNFLQVLGAILSNLSLLDHWREINAAFQLLTPSAKGIDVDRPVTTTVTVTHEVGGSLLNLNLAQESEGFRRFLAQLIALYQTPRKHLLVFENPEKGIYPAALSVLADHFKAYAGDGERGIMLTTQSPELLKAFEPESIRVVEIEDFATRIGPLAADQRKSIEEQLLSAGELLTVEHPRLERPSPES